MDCFSDWPYYDSVYIITPMSWWVAPVNHLSSYFVRFSVSVGHRNMPGLLFRLWENMTFAPKSKALCYLSSLRCATDAVQCSYLPQVFLISINNLVHIVWGGGQLVSEPDPVVEPSLALGPTWNWQCKLVRTVFLRKYIILSKASEFSIMWCLFTGRRCKFINFPLS